MKIFETIVHTITNNKLLFKRSIFETGVSERFKTSIYFKNFRLTVNTNQIFDRSLTARNINKKILTKPVMRMSKTTAQKNISKSHLNIQVKQTSCACPKTINRTKKYTKNCFGWKWNVRRKVQSTWKGHLDLTIKYFMKIKSIRQSGRMDTFSNEKV